MHGVITTQSECPPRLGLNAKTGEWVCSPRMDLAGWGSGPARQVKLTAMKGGQRFECVILALELNYVRGADGNRIGNRFGNPLLDQHQPIGRAVWQGTQYDGINHAEDCRAGANAELQCEHRQNVEL